jgi:hypothetical protein
MKFKVLTLLDVISNYFNKRNKVNMPQIVNPANSTAEFKRFIGSKIQMAGLYVNSSDPIATEISSMAGGNVRYWLPNSIGTMDYQHTRLNVHVDRCSDGSFEIKSFKHG